MDGAVDGGLELVERLPLSQCPQFLHKVIDGLCGRAQPRFQDYGVIWSLREWLEVLENTTAFIKTSVGKDGSSDETSNELSGLNPEYQEMMIKCIKSRNPEIKEALVEKVCAMSSSYLQDFDWQLKFQVLNTDRPGLRSPGASRTTPLPGASNTDRPGLRSPGASRTTPLPGASNTDRPGPCTGTSQLAMSSDKLSTLQMPLVNLDLDIVENGAIAPVSIEMNKEELQNLINSLEAANKVVLQLK